ncbi:hypothetical protein AKJ52_01590 [candidate division MSBL1 archaeon SCGC-AAA382C18]|uniref:ADP-specific phosphofructokinase n=1 Tax=candidate division MSBL1 archaeon SCGC-AAA382C18 TaxID=1698281 RepID=A0A133VK37_9EURY|nr:hypothetical protein AKJ52_01590 [candidate division MSBL1 archaeon SCGC-AAA382C18]
MEIGDFEKMEPNIAVGLESTLDIVITFPSLEELEKFSTTYKGELSNQVKKGYEKVADGLGGEIPIDGRGKEAKNMIRLAEEKGAEISRSIGGNGAQEAITLTNFGARSFFTGGVSKELFSKFSKKDREILNKVDTSYSEKFEKYSPASYILQAPGTNRFIFSEGKGRRINQLRSYIKKLPETISKISREHGGLDAISLAGLQVLFGNKLTKKDFQLMKNIIQDIRNRTDALLFADAGGMGGLSEIEKERLCKIYLLFDTLSTNEDEIEEISQKISIEGEDQIEKMKKLIETSNYLSTLWLHAADFQTSISTVFSENKLKKAQKTAALAGLYRVEKGGYPTWKKLSHWQKNRNINKKGIEKVENIRNKYGEQEGIKIAITSCYEPKEFTSTVGAGDISAAAYLYSLIQKTLDF